MGSGRVLTISTRTQKALTPDPTESQHGCPSLPCGARFTSISNTECPLMPFPVRRSDGLERRLVGNPATRVRIPLAPVSPCNTRNFAVLTTRNRPRQPGSEPQCEPNEAKYAARPPPKSCLIINHRDSPWDPRDGPRSGVEAFSGWYVPRSTIHSQLRSASEHGLCAGDCAPAHTRWPT